MISKEALTNYKSILEDEKTILEQEIKDLEIAPDFGGNSTDIDTEESDESEAMGTNIALMQPLKVRLQEVNDALSKIVNGGYGVCEACKKEIDAELLGVNPESRLCRECKLRLQ
ncbi:MAG: TraR/DksA C4-type zinc finger protein [bacterium]|nr:TraR/DksA C4-type zinc finger protein [bacterium]